MPQPAITTTAAELIRRLPWTEWVHKPTSVLVAFPDRSYHLPVAGRDSDLYPVPGKDVFVRLDGHWWVLDREELYKFYQLASASGFSATGSGAASSEGEMPTAPDSRE